MADQGSVKAEMRMAATQLAVALATSAARAAAFSEGDDLGGVVALLNKGESVSLQELKSINIYKTVKYTGKKNTANET